MERKIIQVVTDNVPSDGATHGTYNGIVVLCNDGTLWSAEHNIHMMEWHELDISAIVNKDGQK